MRLVAYELSRAPVSAFRGDTRAGLASEERALRVEADDLDACLEACVESTSTLYPPHLPHRVSAGERVRAIPSIQN